ncbi:MAG: phospholipid carrier-dependent glycosyltransferase, partial [Myxococcota bacterium]
MKPPFSGRPGIAAATLAVVAVAMRLNNAFRYPPDWGFDASYNWRYIYRMARDWALPHPSAGWSTADPPLFFTVSAALMAVSNFAVVLVPLFNTALGLGIAVLAFVLVREAQPERPLRALLAGWLLLFLPAHVHMSAMVSEEMLTAFFASLTVFLLARRGRDPQAPGLRRAAGV